MTHAVAAGHDHAAVHFSEPLGKCQADPEATLRPVHRRVDLGKHFEHMRQYLRCNANAGIGDLDRNMFTRLLNTEQHVATAIGVLGRIRQQIAEQLAKPDAVAGDLDLLIGQLGTECDTCRQDVRFARLDGRAERLA